MLHMSTFGGNVVAIMILNNVYITHTNKKNTNQ